LFVTRCVGFSVSLLCTGLLSTEVKINILINVTTGAASETDLQQQEQLYLNIRRKKTCIRRENTSFL